MCTLVSRNNADYHSCVNMAGLCCCYYATLAGIPATLVNYLWFILNAAAVLIASLPRLVYITFTVASVQWLCTPEQIKFKLTVKV